LARDCTCLKLYNANFVFASHSSYYFRDDDWDALFKYTDDVRVGVHLPDRDGQVVPSDTMEFRWDYLKTVQQVMSAAGVVKGATMLTEQVLLKKRHVKFTPLDTHGTTYVHRDLSDDVQRGGFHMMPFSKMAETICTTVAGQTTAALGVAYAVSCIPTVVGSLLRCSIPYATLATATLALAPAWVCSGVANARNSIDPPASGRYTVKVVPGWSLSRRNEAVSQVYTFRRVPLSVLEPRITRSPAVHRMRAQEMAASLSLSHNPEKAARSMAAMGFRAGMTPAAVRDTVQAAKDYVEVAVSGNESSLRPSPAPPDSGLALSVWEMQPTSACASLVKYAVAFESTRVALCKSRALTAHFVSVLQTVAAPTTGPLSGPSSALARYLASTTPAEARSESVQRFWAWFSRTLQSSPTVQQWLSTHYSTVTWPHPPTQYGSIGWPILQV
jgi:hypothetical protein